MSDHLRYWNKLHQPPTSALKPIQAGRLKGKSDVNPAWRLKAITEEFGPCGIGWKYTIDKLWTEPGANGEIAAFALVSFYYREEGEWTAPVPGIGGSMLIENERSGAHTSDEAYKMAVTDALSVALKSIGVAGDIYMGNFDGSKYKTQPQEKAQSGQQGGKSPVQGAKPTQGTQGAEQLTEAQAKYRPRLLSALHTLHGEDNAAKKATVKANSALPAKGNFPAREGVEDYRTLDGDRLKFLTHAVEGLAAKASPTLCSECRQSNGTHAPSCPLAQPE